MVGTLNSLQETRDGNVGWIGNIIIVDLLGERKHYFWSAVRFPYYKKNKKGEKGMNYHAAEQNLKILTSFVLMDITCVTA